MAVTPETKLRDFVGRGTKVPVTAFLRLKDPRRSLETGRISGMLEIYDGYTADFVEIDRERVPLEVEQSAALAYTLSESAVWDWERTWPCPQEFCLSTEPVVRELERKR